MATVLLAQSLLVEAVAVVAAGLQATAQEILGDKKLRPPVLFRK
jgi:hypothetical protein